MKNTSLSEYRKLNKLTLREMAAKIGVSQTFYNKIEYGDRNPSYDFIKRFCVAFPKANIRNIFFANEIYKV